MTAFVGKVLEPNVALWSPTACHSVTLSSRRSLALLIFHPPWAPGHLWSSLAKSPTTGDPTLPPRAPPPPPTLGPVLQVQKMTRSALHGGNISTKSSHHCETVYKYSHESLKALFIVYI